MAGYDERVNISALQEIRKKIYLIVWILAFVVVTLIAVTFYHNYEPITAYFGLLPQMSINFVIGGVCLLGLICLLMAARVSRQVLRIVDDANSRSEKMFSLTKDLREEVFGDVLLGKIMDYALATTDSESGSILLIEKDKLVFKVVRGEKAPLLLGTALEKGKGIIGTVAATGKPLRIADASNDHRFNPEVDAITGQKTVSVMCVPLRSKEGIIGVLEVMNKKGGHAYRERDEEIISYLAGQAAVSLVRSKFYEDQRNYEIHLTEMLLDAIDYHIPEKKGHSRRVARYANVIARGLNMSEENKKRLYFACLLHDVGFLKIHADNSYKKETYMRHPVVGFEMIQPINFYSDIAPLILYHHERFDGYGYPSNLKGEEIPLESRIIAIAETFDSMISKSSYRLPVSFDEAIEEIKNKAGSQFDPKLVAIFIEDIDPQFTKE